MKDDRKERVLKSVNRRELGHLREWSFFESETLKKTKKGKEKQRKKGGKLSTGGKRTFSLHVGAED